MRLPGLLVRLAVLLQLLLVAGLLGKREREDEEGRDTYSQVRQ